MQCDVLIIGSGAAGLSLALKLAQCARVILVSKEKIANGATRYAQGGISAVWDDADSADLHVADTLRCGAGLCKPEIVRRVVEHSRESIDWLVELGVEFTRMPNDASHFHLHQEGGHSRRRILHARDSTGQSISHALKERMANNPNITVLDQYLCIDLILEKEPGAPGNRCLGAWVQCQKTKRIQAIGARACALACGGAGKTYLYTSNPDSCTGDGIAMAWRAGCRIANMEMVQFHPTCLYHPKQRNFLISEALRGEGANLRLTANGPHFMQEFDERGDLAPRDVVARAIDHEMKRLGLPCVYLDMRHRPAKFIREHFPTIHERCAQLGINICEQPIPVVPAAHYTCGGIVVDSCGRSDLEGLYAIGEVSHTGLHGANRMASNSLLECIVFAQFACTDILEKLADTPAPGELSPWDESMVTHSKEEVVITHNWNEIRRFMWDYVGIARTEKRLQWARRRAQLITAEIAEHYSHFRIDQNFIELRNIAIVAALIIESALHRKESRGLHYNADHASAAPNSIGRDTILRRHNRELYPQAPE
ncbi:MAG: L-aspartate oxidase, partial [Candidatus Eutrophobiaceae bacterium]